MFGVKVTLIIPEEQLTPFASTPTTQHNTPNKEQKQRIFERGPRERGIFPTIDLGHLQPSLYFSVFCFYVRVLYAFHKLVVKLYFIQPNNFLAQSKIG